MFNAAGRKTLPARLLGPPLFLPRGKQSSGALVGPRPAGKPRQIKGTQPGGNSCLEGWFGYAQPTVSKLCFQGEKERRLGKEKSQPHKGPAGQDDLSSWPCGDTAWVGGCLWSREGKLGKPQGAGSISSFLLSLQTQLPACWLRDLAGGEPRWCESSTPGKLVSIQSSKTCRQSEGKPGLPEAVVEAVKPSPPASHTEPELFMSE